MMRMDNINVEELFEQFDIRSWHGWGTANLHGLDSNDGMLKHCYKDWKVVEIKRWKIKKGLHQI